MSHAASLIDSLPRLRQALIHSIANQFASFGLTEADLTTRAATAVQEALTATGGSLDPELCQVLTAMSVDADRHRHLRDVLGHRVTPPGEAASCDAAASDAELDRQIAIHKATLEPIGVEHGRVDLIHRI